MSNYLNKESICDPDIFSRTFENKVADINNQILLLSKNNNENEKKIKNVKYSIQEIQHFLTNSTLFLTDYKINSCQTIIKKMVNDCDKISVAQNPKKRFGFKKKNVVDLSEETQPKHDSNPEFRIMPSLSESTIINKRCEFILLQNEINNKDISLLNIENCIIEIRGVPGSIQFNNIKNCIILAGPVFRAVFVEFAVNSSFAVACQQLRIHSSCNCSLAIHVTARAIIEDCKDIAFSKYNYTYESIENDFLKSDLPSRNNYRDIADFNWLSSEIPSPNWSIVEASCDWALAKQALAKENNINLKCS
ncbi:TBCC family protein [Megaselia abdita]